MVNTAYIKFRSSVRQNPYIKPSYQKSFDHGASRKTLGPQPVPKNGTPRDSINARILQTLVSGITFILGLRTRMLNPHVHIVSGALEQKEDRP